MGKLVKTLAYLIQENPGRWKQGREADWEQQMAKLG